METDKSADTDSELSMESSEYSSEPDGDDDRIQPAAVVINTDENESPRSLSREEFDCMDNQSIVFGIPGPTEKIACSTLIETRDKTKSNPSFQIPASVHQLTQTHLRQKDISAEIMEKLNKILEHQVVILSHLQIRSQPDAVENPTFDEIAPRPLPQLIPMPAMQKNNLQGDDVSCATTATNINPVVSDAMLAETLRLKPKSSSAGNLAAKLVKIIFKPDELINRNCSGSRGKGKLDEEKLKKLITYVCKAYGVLTEEQTKVTG